MDEAGSGSWQVGGALVLSVYIFKLSNSLNENKLKEATAKHL